MQKITIIVNFALDDAGDSCEVCHVFYKITQFGLLQKMPRFVIKFPLNIVRIHHQRETLNHQNLPTRNWVEFDINRIREIHARGSIPRISAFYNAGKHSL